MHIPDGFLDAKTWVSLSAVSAAGLALAAARTRKEGDEKRIPLMGVMAAFIFAAQMINFPVAGGTSGHFMGGVLAALLLGPFTGILIMSTVLIAQCLVFQDGGLTALGANIFNMGIVGCVGGYYIYKLLDALFQRPGWMSKRNILMIFGSAWASIVLAASFCAAELAFSNTIPFNIAFPAMAGVHAFIGIGEGLITVGVVGFVYKVRPDLFEIEKI
jgi:cobalt/nickel transport system permease protein